MHLKKGLGAKTMVLTWIKSILGILLLSAVLMACAQTKLAVHIAKEAKRITKQAETKGTYKVGKPYQIMGVWYYPKEDPGYDRTGIASWYGNPFHGRRTANGETYNMNALTAAHKTLPMPTFVRVTNLENGRSLVVKVNDRGPFVHGRIIDLSRRGAQLLGFFKQGTAKVRVTAIDQAFTLKSRQFRAPKPVTPPEQISALPALPRGNISVSSLSPPVGIQKSEPTSKSLSGVRVARAGNTLSSSTPVENGKVEIVQVAPNPTIYVQAGVFGQAVNAVRLKARLAYIGPARVTTLFIRGEEFFRVRIGPLVDVKGADVALNKVIEEGVKDAILVVE